MIDEEKIEEIFSSSSDAEKSDNCDCCSDDKSQNDDTIDVSPPIQEINNNESDEVCESSTASNIPNNTEHPDNPGTKQNDDYSQQLEKIGKQFETISSTEQRIFSEMREIHKLYHNEFAGRLTAMQDELEHYRKIDKGRIYDDILGAIARIYNNNESLAEEIQDPKVKKAVRYLLLDLEDILDEYGMSKIKSNHGDKRDPRHCQIHDRIITQDSSLHDTVAKSYNTGFHIGNRTVIKEKVDIYFYDGKISQPAQEITIEKTVEDTVVE